MPELTRLDPRDYVKEIKARLQDDVAWEELTSTELVEKTRRTLQRMVTSIDEQKRRNGGDDEKWVRGINRLRALVKGRLDALPAPTPQSSNKETQAWRAFSARLALILDDYDPTALDEIKAPYGGLTAREWLAAREEKKR